MLYTAAEIIVFLVASAVIGLLIGYFAWARGSTKVDRPPTADSSEEVETLKRQLAATRRRAAAAEAEAAKRDEALVEARNVHERQRRQIEELSRPSTPKVDDLAGDAPTE